MKAYVKPELFYEDFEMNHTIAACGNPIKYGEPFVIEDGVTTVFIAGQTCDFGENDVQGYCYQTGNDNEGYFGS